MALLTILTKNRQGVPATCSILDTSCQKQHILLRDIEKGKEEEEEGTCFFATVHAHDCHL